jgi:hypothetical protein
MTEAERKPKHAGGRPSKLTAALQQKLVTYIKAGAYLNVACAACGIDYTTYRNWVAKGETAASGKFFEFFQAVNLAEAEAEISLVLEWRALARDNWAACAEFLSRRFRQRWGRSTSVELAGPQGGPIQVQQIDQAIEEELAKLAAQISGQADDENESSAA